MKILEVGEGFDWISALKKPKMLSYGEFVKSNSGQIL